MKKNYIVVSVLASLFFIWFFATNLLASSSDKVTICHATDSQSNPYITNQPNKSGDVSGHDDHNGVVWYQGIADHAWGDIIPPFEYQKCTDKKDKSDSVCETKNYPGKNWNTAGQAIWNNNCNLVSSPTPTSTPTPTATATSTATSTATATATATTTSTSTATPTPEPCDDEDCDRPTETPTATATATSTAISNNDVCPNIDGIQLSLPDEYHFDNDGKNCLKFELGGAPQPPAVGGSNVLGVSTSQVLGASTMAGTGAVEDSIFYSMFSLGSLLSSFGIMKNGKKNKKI